MSFDKEYYETVHELQEQINAAVDKLSRYKTSYLDNLCTGDPVKVLNDWLDTIWPLCQSCGLGYAFTISHIDYSIVPSEFVKDKLSRVKHIDMWPASWNVKSNFINVFRQSMTPEIHTAAMCLGLKITINEHETLSEMSDSLFF